MALRVALTQTEKVVVCEVVRHRTDRFNCASVDLAVIPIDLRPLPRTSADRVERIAVLDRLAHLLHRPHLRRKRSFVAGAHLRDVSVGVFSVHAHDPIVGHMASLVSIAHMFYPEANSTEFPNAASPATPSRAEQGLRC